MADNGSQDEVICLISKDNFTGKQLLNFMAFARLNDGIDFRLPHTFVFSWWLLFCLDLMVLIYVFITIISVLTCVTEACVYIAH